MKYSLAFLTVFFLVSCSDSGREARQADSLPAAEQEIHENTVAEHADDMPVPTPVATTEPESGILGEMVAYGEVGGINLRGYLAMPAGTTGPLPGLIVVHEWWGLNEGVKQATERLAGEGYVALAIDLYGGEIAEVPKEAMKMSRVVREDPGPSELNVQAAYEYLEVAVGAPRIGVIGWCMGGRWALKTALLMPDKIDAMVMYYGTVTDDEEALNTLNMPILGLFAANDRIVPVATVQKFRAILRRQGKDAEVFVYPDTNHAFSNPNGGAYNAIAAEDAWQKTRAFFEENLAEAPIG